MKLVKVVLVLLMVFSLSGCKYASDYIDPEDRYIITAIGFEKSANGVLAVIEVPKEISGKANSKTVYSAWGGNVSGAISAVSNKISGELLFSQCPIVLLDESVEGETIDDIFNYCLSNYDISLSVLLIGCKNPIELLNKETNEASVGLAILKSVKFSNKNLNSQSRFAKVINNNYKTGEFKIPYVNFSEEVFMVDGVLVFKNNLINEFIKIEALERYE